MTNTFSSPASPAHRKPDASFINYADTRDIVVIIDENTDTQLLQPLAREWNNEGRCVTWLILVTNDKFITNIPGNKIYIHRRPLGLHPAKKDIAAFDNTPAEVIIDLAMYATKRAEFFIKRSKAAMKIGSVTSIDEHIPYDLNICCNRTLPIDKIVHLMIDYWKKLI